MTTETDNPQHPPTHPAGMVKKYPPPPSSLGGYWRVFDTEEAVIHPAGCISPCTSPQVLAKTTHSDPMDQVQVETQKDDK